jgi:hypothetical protein
MLNLTTSPPAVIAMVFQLTEGFHENKFPPCLKISLRSRYAPLLAVPRPWHLPPLLRKPSEVAVRD